MNPQLANLVGDGERVAQELERGQANRPMVEWFEETQRDLAAQPLVVTLLVEHAVLRQVLLGALAEDVLRTTVIRSTAYPGLLEIRLSDSGYSLEVAGRERLEFDELPSLLGTLKDLETNNADPGSDISVWRVSLLSPPERRGLQLLVPETLGSISNNPALENVIASRSHVLVVAVDDSGSFSPEGVDLVRRLADAVGYILPVAVAETAEPAKALVRELGHSAQRRVLPAQGLVTLPPLLAPGAAAPSLARHLTDAAAVKRLSVAGEMLRARYDADLRQLRGRRQRHEALSREAPQVVAGSHTVEAIRQRATEVFAAMPRMLDESGRRAMLPGSVIGDRLQEQVQGLRAEDLREEQERKHTILLLDERYQHNFEQGLRKAVKAHFKQDIAALEGALATLKQRTEQELGSMGNPQVLQVGAGNDEEIWRRISELMTTDIRYRGQIPRRGFFQRLGAARQAVFGVLMVASLVGTFMGVNFRDFAIIGVLFLLIFIGAVVYSYRSWAAEDAESLSNELGKVRDQLQQEGRRVVTELLREERLRLTEYIEQCKRAFLQQLDNVLKTGAERDQARNQEQRARAGRNLRRVDEQLRELQALAPRIERFQQAVNTMKLNLERTQGEALS